MKNKIVKAYSNISVAARASIWFAVCNALQKGIALLTTPIFTRLLTTEQYGDYTVYQSWYQVISILATLNLFFGVFNNGMTKFSDDKQRFTSSMQGLCTILTIGLFVVYLIGMNFWNKLLDMPTLYMVAMFVELLFVPAFNFWSASQRYEYKYRLLVGVTVIMAFGSPLLGIIAVMNSNYKAEARILSYVLVQVCIGAVFYIYNMWKGKTFFHKDYWKFALKFNIPLIPHYLSAVVLGQADRIMIKEMVGKSEAAIYAVAYSIATMINIIVTAINNSFTPFMYKAIKSKNYDSIRKNATPLIVLIAILSVLAMTFAPEIIKIFAPKEYYDAVWIIPPVAGGVFFNFLYPLFSNVEFYFEKPHYIMVASTLGAIANVALNYIFIPIFGYYAAGYTTLFCYMVYAFAHYYLAKKICRDKGITSKLFDIRFIFVVGTVVALAIVVISFLYQYNVLRYILCLLEFALLCIYAKKINLFSRLKKEV